ncbi:hypothetical protein JCM7447_11940 [Corynebacterium amycolatum]
MKRTGFSSYYSPETRPSVITFDGCYYSALTKGADSPYKAKLINAQDAWA